MTPNTGTINRDELLRITGDVVRDLHEKVRTGRFRDLDMERAKDSKLRILVSALGVCDTLLKNQEDTTQVQEGKAAIDELMDYLREHEPEDGMGVVT